MRCRWEALRFLGGEHVGMVTYSRNLGRLVTFGVESAEGFLFLDSTGRSGG